MHITVVVFIAIVSSQCNNFVGDGVDGVIQVGELVRADKFEVSLNGHPLAHRLLTVPTRAIAHHFATLLCSCHCDS